MSQVLHILRKDLLRYRWAWITLLAVGGVKLYLLGTYAGLMDDEFNTILRFLVGVVDTVLLGVIAVMVVQEESLGDPDAYWLSRPFSRIGLLVAKLLFFCLIILGIHALAESIVLIMNDGPRRVIFPFLAIIGGLAFWVWVIFLAAQTRSFPRFLLRLFIVGLVFVLASISLTYLADKADLLDDDWFGLLPHDMDASTVGLLQKGWWLAMGLTVLVVYYQTRRLRIAWLLLLPTLIGSILLTPNSDYQIHYDYESESALRDLDLKLVGFENAGYTVDDSGEWRSYSAIFTVDDAVNVDKLLIRVSSASAYKAGTVEDGYIEVMGGLSQPRKTTYKGQKAYAIDAFYLSPDQYAVVKDKAVDYTLQMNVQTTQDTELVRIPIRKSSGFVHDGSRHVITDINSHQDELTIRFHTYSATFLFEDGSDMFDVDYVGITRLNYALINRNTGKIIGANSYPGFTGFSSTTSIGVRVPLAREISVSDYDLAVYKQSTDSSQFERLSLYDYVIE